MPLLEVLYQKERAQQVSLLPFWYSVDFNNGAVAASSTASATTSISSDSHFVARYFDITVYASSGFGTVVNTLAPPLLIGFFDTGSGRNLQDNPQPIQNLCGGAVHQTGSGVAPFVLPEPWLIRAGSVAQVTLVNIGLITFPRVIVSLIGMKVYRFGNSGPADI